jgi:hypothetical protein
LGKKANRSGAPANLPTSLTFSGEIALENIDGPFLRGEDRGRFLLSLSLKGTRSRRSPPKATAVGTSCPPTSGWIRPEVG